MEAKGERFLRIAGLLACGKRSLEMPDFEVVE
jgi:hypothetical protein